MSPREVSKAIELAKRDVTDREETVTRLEVALRELEAALASPREGVDLVALAQRHEAAHNALEDAVQQWERAAERLEALTVRR
jgi:exonuclease VII small subunit